MGRLWMVTPVLLLALTLVGCGGGGVGPGPAPGPDDGATQQIGPFVVRTAATAGLQAQNIPSDGDAAFVALSGAKITYLAVQEMLDRIVYERYYDIVVCDLFGGNEVLITSDGDYDEDEYPRWSPDGARIAYARTPFESSADVVVRNADGSGFQQLTTHPSADIHPTWSPDGLKIAFTSLRDGQYEIYSMNADGSEPTRLTNNPDSDMSPWWSADGQHIYFQSDRDGDNEIYRIPADGGAATKLTSNDDEDTSPSVSADGSRMAWTRAFTLDAFIYLGSTDGSEERRFTTNGAEYHPCLSSDGSMVIYAQVDAFSPNLWLRETTAPYRAYQVTDTLPTKASPHLGSPTPQIRRVLIGAAGEDHGYDPLWPYVYAAIVAFDDTGYLNFLRIGIPSNDCDTIEVEPIPDTGNDLVGLRVEAGSILNLREDQGIGQDPSWWNIVAESPSSVLLYLDAHTGKLVSVLLTRDTVYPAAAPVAHTLDGGTLRVAGDIAAAYANGGELVAEDVGAVEFECARLVRAF